MEELTSVGSGQRQEVAHEPCRGVAGHRVLPLAPTPSISGL